MPDQPPRQPNDLIEQYSHLYEIAGSVYRPTDWTGSPWLDGAQHGAPANALMMRAAEAVAAESGMVVGRLTIDLLKPVPKSPLEVSTTILRRGRRLSVVDVSAAPPGGAPVLTGRAVLQAEEDFGGSFSTARRPLPGPDAVEPVAFMSPERHGEMPFGFHQSLVVRWDPVAGLAWLTSPLDMAEGVPMTPLERCAALSDFATVMSVNLESARRGEEDPEHVETIMNLDTTVYLSRAPVGDWFAFSDPEVTECRGRGVTSVALHDQTGALGRVAQTVIGTTITR